MNMSRPEPPEDSSASRPVRQLHALIRDDVALRRGLQDAENARFDDDTADRLRSQLESLLETVHSVALDDQLWERLSQAAYPPLTRVQLDELTSLVWTALPVLLEAFGYRCPPPPPAHQLVDDTQVSLGAAFAAGGVLVAGHERGELVRQARWYFLTFTMRVRRQIEFAPLGARSAAVRQAARETSSVASTLAPVVIGGVADVATEAGLIAVGVPAPLAKIFGKLSEHGAKLGVEALIGWMERRRAQTTPLEPSPTPDPVLVRLGAIATEHAQLENIVRTVMDREQEPDSAAYRATVRNLGGHVRRLGELIVDHGLNDPLMTDALADLDDALACAVDAARSFRRRPGMAAEAVDRLRYAFDRAMDAYHRAEIGGPGHML